MKTGVRKLRSVEKHRNYALKRLGNNDDNDDDVEGDDENGNESKSSESDLPELKCGMKRLLSGKNERGAKCVECEHLVEDARSNQMFGSRWLVSYRLSRSVAIRWRSERRR
jgi:hypothetical protein